MTYTDTLHLVKVTSICYTFKHPCSKNLKSEISVAVPRNTGQGSVELDKYVCVATLSCWVQPRGRRNHQKPTHRGRTTVNSSYDCKNK